MFNEGSYRSDHSMIILDISFVQFQKGKPLWKHNNSLLSDKDYLRTMNNKIDKVKKQYALPVYNMDKFIMYQMMKSNLLLTTNFSWKPF